MFNIVKLIWLEAQSAINHLELFATLSPLLSLYPYIISSGSMYLCRVNKSPLTAGLVFINFSWRIPFRLSKIKKFCFKANLVSPAHLFLSSPDYQLLLNSHWSHQLLKVMFTTVTIQLKESDKLLTQFSRIFSNIVTTQGLTKNLEVNEEQNVKT